MDPSTTIHIELGTADAPVLGRWNTHSYRTEPFAKWGHDGAYAIFTENGVVLVDPRELAPLVVKGDDHDLSRTETTGLVL